MYNTLLELILSYYVPVYFYSDFCLFILGLIAQKYPFYFSD